MKIKQVYLGAFWVIMVSIGFTRFLVKKPKATPTTLKFIISELHTLPHRLKYKVHIDEERARIKDKLAECASLFARVQVGHENSFALRWLEENLSLFPNRWTPLYILVRVLKGKSVVETGVAQGESTCHILRALEDNGDGLLYSIDLPNQFYLRSNGKFHAEFNPPRQLPGCLVPSELRDRWKLTLGKSLDVLPQILNDLGEIDLFLHDSEHTYETMAFEYSCAWNHIRAGGYLVSDDVTWNSAFSDFAKSQRLKPIIINGQGFLCKPK